MNSSTKKDFLLTAFDDIRKALNVIKSWICPPLLLRSRFVIHFNIRLIRCPKPASFILLLIRVNKRVNIIAPRRRHIPLLETYLLLALFLSNSETWCFFQIEFSHAYGATKVIVLVAVGLSTSTVYGLSGALWETVHLFRGRFV